MVEGESRCDEPEWVDCTMHAGVVMDSYSSADLGVMCYFLY